MSDTRFDETPLVTIPTPNVPFATLRIMAEDLVRLLKRLVSFVSRTGAPALRHVWVEAVDGQLVGAAYDLASGAQATAKVYADSTRPLVGIDPAGITALARHLHDIGGLVDITTALAVKHGEPTGGIDLVATEGGQEVARVPARQPTPSDERLLAQLTAELTATHQMALDSQLPLGYADLNPAAFARFGVGPRGPVGAWFAPNGRVYVEVDPRFRGHIKAARAGHGRTERPTPTAPLAFPREAAA